ncbi:MAG: putative Ig domain-containing protein, partial [Planctomycetes bacterium]|nr:putative Ig domain-containing protein [Planctomycetota bacterium]
MRNLLLVLAFTLSVLAASGCTNDSGEVVRGSDLRISTTAMLDGVEGVPYTMTLAAIGQLGPFTWEISESSTDLLPTSLVLTPSTGVISGTPDAGTAGSYSVTFIVTDANGESASKALSLTIGLALNFPAATFADALSGESYAGNLSASGGLGVYTYSLDGTSPNALPTGLVLDAATGSVSGTPAFGTEGNYTLRFAVSDGNSSLTQDVALAVNLGPVKITLQALPNATELAAYSETLVAMGGSGVYTWSVSPNSADQLPAGFALDPNTGVVSGNSGPQSTGTFTITFLVNDGTDSHEAEVTFTIVPGPLTIFTSSIDDANEGQAYSFQLIATGGTESYTWSVDGASADPLPAAFSLAGDGTITGTAAFDSEGDNVITFRVDDGQNQLTTTLTFTIIPPNPDSILAALISGGGGQSGGGVDADDLVHIRVANLHAGGAMAGVQVAVNDANGDLLSNGVTDATGTISFDAAMIGGTPMSITVRDPLSNSLVTRAGSATSPLREFHAVLLDRTPAFDLSYTGFPAGEDLVVTLNGEVVATEDNAAATGTIELHRLSAISANEPWLLVLHAYDNANAGVVDGQTLLQAAYLSDSLGSAMLASPTALTLDATSGVGTATATITSGACTIETLDGVVTPPALSAGITTIAWVFAEMVGPFGNHAYNQRVLIPNAVGGAFAYSIQYPSFDG